VVVTDPVPSGTVFDSATTTSGSVTLVGGNTGTVRWSVGDMLTSDTTSAQLKIKVVVKGKSLITNTATVTSDTPDPNTANNTATVSTSTKRR
jgi:hypothetical protein